MSLDNFLSTYQRLGRDNLELLEQIYSADIQFVDPAHSVAGLPELKAYFVELYANVTEIRFEFHSQYRVGDQVFVEWWMSLRHPRLARGRLVRVPGISCLHFTASGLVDRHRDYFDLGALLYEQLPVLGGLVRAIKRRFAR
ncbi:MAG: nuclear transport factor 2 family protein [Pelovirga sp.]